MLSRTFLTAMPVKNWAREQLDSWQLFLSQVYHLPSTRHQPVASSACFIQCCPVSSRTLHNQPVYVLHMQIVSPAADAETATWVPTEVPLDLGPDVQGFVALWKNQTTKASVYMRYQLRVHFRNFIESQVFGLLCPEVSKRYGPWRCQLQHERQSEQRFAYTARAPATGRLRRSDCADCRIPKSAVHCDGGESANYP
jgi:hypothetical protein